MRRIRAGGAFDGGALRAVRAVDIVGALGGRMDHAIGNIQLMYQFFC
ncbi:MAG: hypothetical protein ACLR8P_08020 [Clostridium fessum]